MNLGVRGPLARLLLAAALLGCAMNGFSTVTYRGQTIPLSRRYADFHAYRDDPENLPPEQVPRVAVLVKTAPVPPSFPSRAEAMSSLTELMFPGYGFSAMSLQEPVAVFAIEIPRTDEERYVAVAERGGSWIVIDDFIWPSTGGLLNRATIVGGTIRYFNQRDVLARQAAIVAPAGQPGAAR
jgi:hypothetical protein